MSKKIESLQESLSQAKLAATTREGRLATVATALGKAEARPLAIAAAIAAIQAADSWAAKLAAHGLASVLDGAVDAPAKPEKAKAPKAKANGRDDVAPVAAPVA